MEKSSQSLIPTLSKQGWNFFSSSPLPLGSRVADSPDAAIPIDWVQAHTLLLAKPASVRQIQEKNRGLYFLDINEKDLALTESNWQH